MKLDVIDRQITSANAIGKVHRATVYASRKVFDMFSDNTYANKPEAIARELVANGIDAQRLNGNADVPVRVILPTELEPTFTVIDCGPGMSEEFTTGPFMAYTNGSTKDGNDDDIGGFGIGSKSPLSYVDQFTLRIVHEAILTIYTLFKDEEGIPSIVVQAQTTTDEPSGVQVSFPVEEKDIEAFRAAAQTALQYFQPLPAVENGTLSPPDYQYVGKGWAMRKSAGPLGVIMGGVRYPVTTANLGYNLRNLRPRIQPLLEYGLDLTLPIGAVPIAMSREQLQYKDVTSDVIEAKLNEVIDDVIETFSTIFDTAPSLWEAAKMLNTEAPDGGGGARGRLLAANAKYKGEKLERSIKLPYNMGGKDPTRVATHWDDRAWIIETLVGKRRTTIGSSRWQTLSTVDSVYPGAIGQVIVDDLPNKAGSKTLARIRAFVEDQKIPQDTLVIRPGDGDVQRILRVFESPNSFIFTSDLPVPVSTRKSVKNKDRPRVRMFAHDGQLGRGYHHTNLTNLTLSDSKPGITEIPYTAQPATGILVTMSSFDIPTPDIFYKNMQSGLIRYDEIVFVNAGDAVKIKDNFVDFFEEHDKRLKKALAAEKDLPARIALSGVKIFQPIFDIYKALPEHLTPAQLRRPFGRIVALYLKYVEPLDQQQRRLAPFITPTLPKGVDPAAMMKEFYEKQPDANLLLSLIDDDNQDHLKLFMKNL